MFLNSSWLKTPGVAQVQLPYRTNHVDDTDVLAALRAIQEEAKSELPALGYTVPYAIGNILLTA
mgnify:CR=1 FL=1